MFFSIIDYVGIGLFALGLIIFLVAVAVSKQYREYLGIKEYRRIRDKLTTREEEQEEKEEEEVIEIPEGNYVITTIGRVVGLILSLYFFSEISTTVLTSINQTGSPFTEAIAMTKMMVPATGIIMTTAIILGVVQGIKEGKKK